MTHPYFTAEDQDFLQAIEELKWPLTLWHHAAQMRLTWLLLTVESDMNAALERLRTLIPRYNEAQGILTHHETSMHAFATYIQHRRLTDPQVTSWSEFAALHRDLLDPRPILDRHFTGALMASTVARTSLVAADKKPLPAIGTIRLARSSDAAAIRAIYAPCIVDSTISFEYEVPSEEEMAKRIETILTEMPWIVLEHEGQILGYAYASKHRARDAYRWTAEVSIYVAPEAKLRGLGRMLYTNLFRIIKDMGYNTALGGITMPNDASVRLHESLGFTLVGVYHNVGFKLGRWNDVGWYEKRLGALPAEAPELKKLSEIELSFPR